MEKFKKEEQAKSEKLDELSHLKDKVTKTSLNQNVILRYQQAMSKLQVDTKNYKAYKPDLFYFVYTAYKLKTSIGIAINSSSFV